MNASLIIQLAVASAMVAATIFIHLIGLGGLIALMRNHQTHLSTRRRDIDQVIILLGVAFGLFALHAIEIWLYAGLYWVVTGWPAFEESLYFSTATYSTLGATRRGAIRRGRWPGPPHAHLALCVQETV